jgi:hypothetical protein
VPCAVRVDRRQIAGGSRQQQMRSITENHQTKKASRFDCDCGRSGEVVASARLPEEDAAAAAEGEVAERREADGRRRQQHQLKAKSADAETERRAAGCVACFNLPQPAERKNCKKNSC